MAKTLIAFFSRVDENYFGGAMRYVKVGNTEIVAGIMKDMISPERPSFHFVPTKEAGWELVKMI